MTQIVITNKHIKTIIPVRVGDLDIETKPTAKLLRVVMIGTKMSFGEQTRPTAFKIASISRLKANAGGSPSSRHRLLMHYVNSVQLLGYEFQPHALNKSFCRNQVLQVQRVSELQVALPQHIQDSHEMVQPMKQPS